MYRKTLATIEERVCKVNSDDNNDDHGSQSKTIVPQTVENYREIRRR